MPTRATSASAYDLVVVGGGIAGLYGALCAAADARVLVLSKGPLFSSASYLAQGGVAAACGSGDSPELHAEDTLRAGRRLSRPSAVRALTREAPVRIVDLVDLGVRFDPEPGQEGGHSRPRIFHAGGAATGKEIARVLAERVLAHPRIDVSEGEPVRGIWTSAGRCVGVLTDRRRLAAPATVLATGGAAALWERTTNPRGAVGDGITLAYRAGAALADLEFVQFHPTALAGSTVLLSEALRGAGALLVDADGRRFTDELAPRDVVARAIDRRGTALLDLRPVERRRFPGLMSRIEQAGYDPGGEPIPVEPAAHYTMGGIATDLEGRTEVEGLFAAGECACTGVHGANRLASNSLLECLVFGRRAALASLRLDPPSRFDPPVEPAANVRVTAGLRRRMWRNAGLVRDADGLGQLCGSRHLLAGLIARSALFRSESRGAHFRVDHPAEDPQLEGHVVFRAGCEPVLERWA